MDGAAATRSRSRVLFLCVRNSCRSQMAEAWTRTLKGELLEAHSAGVRAAELDPRAVKVMAEVGVDMRGHASKTVDHFKGIEFDYVVTVCDGAREACPRYPGKAKVVHVEFDDPPALARGARTEEQALAYYRRVRDEIRAFVEKLPGELEE